LADKAGGSTETSTIRSATTLPSAANNTLTLTSTIAVPWQIARLEQLKNQARRITTNFLRPMVVDLHVSLWVATRTRHKVQLVVGEVRKVDDAYVLAVATLEASPVVDGKEGSVAYREVIRVRHRRGGGISWQREGLRRVEDANHIRCE
jgi:hypothetical protein